MRLSMCARGDCAICKYAGDIGCSVEEQIAMVTDNARIIADALEDRRERGYWYVEPGIGRKCSVCDFDIGNDLDYMDYVNYCPSCGAKMEGANRETD